jgi:cytosine/adenosine deaminase-related metal-dependent hydrolase
MIFFSPPNEPWTIRARLVFPVDAPPIAGGRVTIRGEHIVRVAADGPADLDVGNAALLPGFVNAHTHLDLGMLHGRCPPTPDFTAWLRCVIAGRWAASPERVQQAVADGITACLRSGTTLVGDISAAGASWERLAASPLRAVVFLELLGLPHERADLAIESLHEWLCKLPAESQRHGDSACRCRPGISPHAPYSAHRRLLERSASEADIRSLPWAIHLAESREELQVLRRMAGPFVEFLRELNAWSPDGLVTSPEEVVEIARHVRTALLVHGNYLAADAPVWPGQTIVYCPRTHTAFSHSPHPLVAFLERGVRIALGTDSLASNPDLDILAEARHVHAHRPELAGDQLLRMLTVDGAAALGWGDHTGTLTPGKLADLVVLPLRDTETADPHTLLWESELTVQAVMIGGRWTGL